MGIVQGVVAYTIISRAYVPHARVLAASYLHHHPDGQFWALLIDDLHGEVDELNEPFKALRLDELDLEPAEIHRMAMLFGNRLIAAIKPWAFEHFIARGAEAALYVDSDFVVFDSLDAAGRAAAEHGVLVVPHVVQPVPDDQHLPDETVILGVGTFNAGFFGVGRDSAGFLAFMKDRLRRECHTDVLGMRVNEQRWLDFVPALFDHVVLRDPGVDVAPWNVHERRLTRDRGRLLAGGSPLRAFHFSGFDPRVPSVLSARDYWDRPRVPMDEEPVLIELCDNYRGALFDAGFEKAHRVPFAFDFLADGRPIYSSLRKLYATNLTRAETDGGALPPDPFDPSAMADFDQWMAEAYRKAGLAVPRRLQPGGPATGVVEDWAGRLVAVGSGSRTAEGVIRLNPKLAGPATLGPYAQLGVGAYRVAVEIGVDRDHPEEDRALGEGTGPWGAGRPNAPSFDVFLDGYILAHATAEIEEPGRVLTDFTISEDLEQMSLCAGIEIRMFCEGATAGVLEGVLVERFGDAATDSHGIPDRFEWLPAMVAGNAGQRKGESIVQVAGWAGFVAMGPHWRLRGGRYRADVRLHSDGVRDQEADHQLGLLEFVVDDHVLAYRPIDRRAIDAGQVTVDFEVAAPWVGLRSARVQLRLRAGAGSALGLDRVTVGRLGDAELQPEPGAAEEWITAMWISDLGRRVGSEIHASAIDRGILAFGPHWRLFGGRYRAAVVLGTAGAPGRQESTAPAALAEVVVDGVVAAEQTVTSSSLNAGPGGRGAVQVLEFDVVPTDPQAGRDVEVRITSMGSSRLALRSVTVGPVDAQ